MADIKAKASELYKSGDYGAAEGQYSAAAAAFEQAEDAPAAAVCRGNRAAALLALRRPGEAAVECARAAALDATYARARQRLGTAVVRAGGFTEAIGAAEGSLKGELEAMAAAREKGNALFKEGDKAGARDAYGVALDAHPTAPGAALLRCNRAACRAALGDAAGALQDAEDALAEDESYTKAKLRRAAALAALGDSRAADAVAAYRELRALIPGDDGVCDALFAAEKAAGNAGAKKETAGVIVVTDGDDYRRRLRAAPGLIAVDFTATWCGPCRQVAPVFAQLALAYKTTTFLKVDVDDVQEVASMEAVRSMPTFKFFKAGKTVATFSGADGNRCVVLLSARSGGLRLGA